MMKSKVLTILLLFTLAIGYQSCDTKLNVDNPEDFYKYIGEDGNQWGVDLVTDADGDIFVLGKTESTSDGKQIYVVKTDSRGIMQWRSILGDPGDEEPKDIELLDDGNLILVSDRTEIGTGEKDFVIYRVNSTDGSVIGTPVIVGNPGVPDYVNSITQINDGFLTASYIDNGSFKEGYAYRFDENLVPAGPSWNALVSQLTSLGGYDCVPIKVFQFDDDVYYTFGYTNTVNNGDAVADYNFFVSVGGATNVSINGLLIIPGPDLNSDERLTSVRRMSPESGAGYVLTGYVSYPSSGQQDLYILKTPLVLKDALLSNLGSYLLGSPKVVTTALSTISSSPASVFSSENSGFLLLAQENLSGNGNIYLTKVDRDLEDAWSDPHKFQVFGGLGNDLAGAVAETSNGRILVVGTMVVGEVNGQSKIVLMNLSPNGMFGE